MKKQVSWTIDEEIIKKLGYEADKEFRSISYTVNRILNDYFKSKGKKNE